MRPLLPLVLSLVAASGCNEVGVLHTVPIPPLDFQLDSPVYGQFAGEGAMRVAGSVGTTDALVIVEGQAVDIQPDGTFEVFVPYEFAWRNIDIEAMAYEEHEVYRIPTFAGFDPQESWPGAVTLRLTESGLAGAGRLLGGLIDDLLGTGIGGAIPPIQTDGFTLDLQSFSADPSQVTLVPEGDELEVQIKVTGVRLQFNATVDLGFITPFDVPLTISLDEASVGLAVGLSVDEGGSPGLALGEPEVDLSLPRFAFGAADLGWLSDLLANTIDLGDLISDAIGQGLGADGPLSLGGPLAFEQDLLGQSISLRLDDLRTDSRGVGLKLGLGLGQPIPDDLGNIPFPAGDGDPPPDLAAGLHDGLLSALLQSELLDLLEQDIQLPGLPGQFLGNIVTQLPGGAQAPENNGWCLNLEPGQARLARFGRAEGASLVNIYLPDATLTFGYLPPGATTGCETWLSAGLALQVGLGIDGTGLDLNLSAPEGILKFYGAQGYESEEQQQRIVDQLARQLSGLLGLLGGLGGNLLDLDDLLGGLGGDALGLDGLNLQILQAVPALDASGEPIEGMSELGIGLFGVDED